MEVLAIIPARGGSKGIPMKNLSILNDKPLLFYTINAAFNSKYITRTIVSTDHEDIASYAQQMGAEIIKRPRNLSGDKIAIEPIMSHVLCHLKKEDYKPELIILLQNTSPLRTAKHIDESIVLLRKKKFDSILSVSKSHHLFWAKHNLKASPINYNPLKRPNRQQMKNQFVENGAIYVTTHSSFYRSKCRISGKIGLYEMPEKLSLQIDSKFELNFAEQILEMKK